MDPWSSATPRAGSPLAFAPATGKLGGVMRTAAVIWIAWIACTACSTARSNAPDADASADAPPAPLDAPGAYRHTILIDGSDDFVAAEQFPTTSAAYAARVAWDDEHVYVGYSGPDLDPAALDTASKWLFVYVDFDPGAGSGAATSQRYNTQQAAFPAGFGAELYARWKCDASFASIEQRLPDDTYTTLATPTAAQAGDFVELAIPRVLLGGAETIGLVTWMINEKPDFEGNFAGLYADNFTDCYGEQLPLTRYLRVDFASSRAPNDPANAAP
jgi:hypothetical protein